MLPLLSDENFNGDIIDGLRRRQPGLDIARVQDEGLQHADDPTILAWAAEHDRILLTHDRATVPAFAYERVRRGLRMPGVFVVSNRLAPGRAIDAILLLALASFDAEWENQVVHLPL